MAAMAPSILIYTRTLGFRHDSIPTAANVIAEWGEESGLWDTVHTEDPDVFTADNLTTFDAIVWISTTGEVLNATQITTFQTWLQNGGHFASIHDATNALVAEPFYGNLTGAYFCCHPTITNATYQISDSTHPSTSLLPALWDHYDEVYQYRTDPRDTNITLLLSAIQSSYNTSINATGITPPVGLTPGGAPQPIAWFREPGHNLSTNLTHNGRLFQTGLGHANSTWLNDTLFRDHIFGGLNWLLDTEFANLTAPSSITAAAAEANSTEVPSSSATITGSNATSTPKSGAQANMGGGVGMIALAAVMLHVFRPVLRFFQ